MSGVIQFIKVLITATNKLFLMLQSGKTYYERCNRNHISIILTFVLDLKKKITEEAI
jgi:hypothetical protein